MRFASELRHGVLLRRYKRFLADVRLDDGALITAHTANPGAMTGLTRPGRAVALSHHDNPKRKLAFSWELVRIGRRWVGVNPMLSNALVADAIRAKRIADLELTGSLRHEVRCGDSRLDLLLENTASRGAAQRCWVEVKTVTLMDGNTARFPDAPTERGRRHLFTLRDAVRNGDRAALCFLVQRSDARVVAPADAVDPAYGRALREVAAAGVEVYALGCRVGLRGIVATQQLPVDLS